MMDGRFFSVIFLGVKKTSCETGRANKELARKLTAVAIPLSKRTPGKHVDKVSVFLTYNENIQNVSP